MKILGKITISILLSPFIIPLWCRIVFTSDDLNKFIHLQEGLSQVIVFGFIQDYQGFMGIGTRNDLNKYNGVGFTIYEHDIYDTTSISHSWIEDVLEDSYGNIRVGTINEMNCYNRINIFD